MVPEVTASPIRLKTRCSAPFCAREKAFGEPRRCPPVVTPRNSKNSGAICASRSPTGPQFVCVSQGKTFPLTASNTSTISTATCTARSPKSFRKSLQFRASRSRRQVPTPSMPKSSANVSFCFEKFQFRVSVSAKPYSVLACWSLVTKNQQPTTKNVCF